MVLLLIADKNTTDLFNPLNANLTKWSMVKHTQTIRRQFTDELCECV